MAILLNGRDKITCKVGIRDLSKELVSFSANYASVNLPESGMSMMTGTLTLTQAEDTNLDFDTRFVQTWRRGTKITLQHKTLALPICGESYIISADYDMASTLSISFGCLLSLFNFRTTSDTGVCLEFGEEKPIGFLVQEMLIAAGVPADKIEIGSFLFLNKFKIIKPYLIGASQSIIQAAAKIVGQYGGILIQRPTGFVSIIYITEDHQYTHFNKAEDLQSYTRTGLPETVIKKITFDYNKVIACSTLGASSKSIRSGDTVVEVEESRDKDLRTTTSTIKEYRDVNNDLKLISTTKQSSKFQAASTSYNSVSRNGNIQSLKKCFPDSDSKILTREVLSESDNTELVKGWLSAKATAGSNASSFNISGTITASRTFEEYQYSETGIIKTTNVSQPRAVAIPLSGDLTLGRPGGQQITDVDPTTLVPLERTIEIWSKPQQDCRKWSYTKTVYKNRSVVQPQEIELEVKNAAKPIESIVEESLELVPISRESLYNQEEPTFETFQVNVEVAESPKQIIIGSGIGLGSVFEVEDEVFLGDYAVVDKKYFEQFCSEIMTFRNGRILGMQVALSPWMIENFNDFLPLFKTKVIEPSNLREGVASILMIDSPSIVGSDKEMVVSYVGSFVAFSDEPLNGNYFSDNLTYPATLPNANPIQSYRALPVNYSINTSFTYTHG